MKDVGKSEAGSGDCRMTNVSRNMATISPILEHGVRERDFDVSLLEAIGRRLRGTEVERSGDDRHGSHPRTVVLREDVLFLIEDFLSGDC